MFGKYSEAVIEKIVTGKLKGTKNGKVNSPTQTALV